MKKRTKRLLGGLIGALLLAFILLHTSPAKGLFRRLLVRSVLSVFGGELTIGRLDYRLWRGQIWLEQLHWAPKAELAPLALDSSEVEVLFSPVGGVSIFLASPELTVFPSASTAETAEQAPWRPTVYAWLSQVRAVEGVLRVLGTSGEPWLEMSSVQLSLTSGKGRHESRIRSSEIELRPTEHRITVGTLETDLQIDGRGLVLKELEIQKGSSSARAWGTIVSFNPFFATLDANLQLDAGVMRELDPRIEVSGDLSGSIHLEANEQGERLEAEVQSSGLWWRTLGPFALDAQARLVNGVFESSRLAATGYGGSLQAQLDAEENRQSVQAKIDGIQIPPLVHDLLARPLPLNAQASGEIRLFLADWNFEQTVGEGAINLSPHEGVEGIPLEGNLLFSVRDELLQLTSEQIALPHSRIDLDAQMELGGKLDASFGGRLETLTDLRFLLRSLGGPVLPEGLDGTLTAEGHASGSIQDISLTTSLTGRNLQLGGDLFELDGELRMARNRLAVETLSLRGRNGTLLAQGGVPLSADAGLWDLSTSLEGVDISWPWQSPEPTIKGTLRGSFVVTGPVDDPDLSGSIHLRPLHLPSDARGEASLSLRKSGPLLLVDELSMQLDDGSFMEASGSYRIDSRQLSANLRGEGLRLSQHPRAREVLPDLETVVTSVAVELEGPIDAPVGEARLTLAETSLRGEPLPSVSLTARSDGSMVWLEARLPEDWLLASGQCRLESPYPVEARFHLSELPFDELFSAFPSLVEAQARLAARGQAQISFSAFHPGDILYVVRVDEIVGSYLGITGGTGAPFHLQGDRNSVQVKDLHIVGTDTDLSIEGQVPLGAEASLGLLTKGNVRLELLNTLYPTAQVEGQGRLDLRLEGTWSHPELEGELQIEDGSGTWEQIRVDGVTARLTAAQGMLILRDLQGSALRGEFQMDGELPWRAPSPERPAKLRLDIRRFDLGELLPSTGDPSANPSLLFSMSGIISASGFDFESVRGAGEIPEIRGGWTGLSVKNTKSAPWYLDKGGFRLPSLELAGAGTNLIVQAQVALSDEGVTWESHIEGNLDSALLNPWISAEGGPVVSGNVETALEIKGGPDGLRMDGSGSLRGLQLVFREPALVVSNIRGDLRIQNQSIVVSNLAADAGGGSIEGSGIVSLSGPGTGWIDAELACEAVRLDYPEGLRSSLSGSFRFRGEEDYFLLSGEGRLLEVLFRRNLTLQSELLSALRQEAAAFVEEESFLDKVRLDLRVRTENDARIDNNLAQMQGGVNLRLGGTLASPEVDGIIIAQPDGELRFGGHVYQIESARLALSGYPTGPTQIDLRARTNVSGVDIVLQLQGSTDNLTVTLTAPDEPDLTRADVASLLVTGRTLDKVPAGQQLAREQVSSYLSGTLAGLAQRELGAVLPFDRLSVGPSQIGSEVDPGVRFSLGKAITQDLFLTYSIGLNDTQSQLWILDYQLPQNLVLRAVRQEDNTFAGSVSQKLNWYVRGRPRGSGRDKRSKIVSIELEGEFKGSEEKELRKSFRLKVGSPYDYWRAMEAADRARSYLSGRGYLSAIVDVNAKPSGDRNVSLTFRFQTGKPVEIHWEGDDAGRAVRNATEKSWDGRIPESVLVTELATKAERTLQSDGYYLARVIPSAIDTGDGWRRITFTVDKGPKGKRIVLAFDGIQAISVQELTNALPSRSSIEFFEMVSGKTGRLREALRLYYASRGYLDAKIGEPQTIYEEDSGEFRVAIPIEEGAVLTVSQIELRRADSLSEVRLRQQMRPSEGRPFNLSDFIHDRSALANLYRREGFSQARIESQFERRDQDLKIIFQIEEGLRSRVGNVKVVGNRRTRTSTIARELVFKKGDPVRISDFTQSQRRLYELGVFRSVDVRIEPTDTRVSESDVIVEVSELSELAFNYGVRFEAESGLELVTETQAPNLFGGAQHASLTTRWSSKGSLVRTTFRTPYLSGHRLDTDLLFAWETDEEDFADTRSWSFTFQQTRRLKERLGAQWSSTFKRTHTTGKVFTGPFSFDFTADRAIFTASLFQDTRNSVLSPRRGRFWNLTFQAAPGALGSDIRFAKLFGQLYAFWPLSGEVVWASSYRIGLAQGLGQVLLPEDRFRAGGGTTVRGFAQDDLGPVDPVADTNIGGEALVVLNQEIRFPVYRWVGGVAFYDAGNVFLDLADFNPINLRHSAGFGLRVDAPFGMLRLDWARVLDRQPWEKANRFWFTFGHAF